MSVRCVLLAAMGAVLLAVTGCTISAAPLTPSSVPVASPSPAESSTSEIPAADARVVTPSGLIGLSADWSAGDIQMSLDGAAAHRVFGADDDGILRQCPAFAPDGFRLAFGRASGDDFKGWDDAALVIADVTSDGQATIVQEFELGALTNAPCPIWSPDGHRIAFGALTDGRHPREPALEVWILDVGTGDIERVMGLRTTDMDWAPDGSQLYIASSRGIVVYSLADSSTRTLDDTSRAKSLAVSPDGRTLVLERRPMRAEDQYELWRMNPDGSDQRKIVEEYGRMHGIGPVWSPDGGLVVFQRVRARCASLSEELDNCPEQHEVVVVTMVADDPTTAFGTQVVLPQPQTGQGEDRSIWFPYSVTWSPDGASLLYLGWWEGADPMAAVTANEGMLVVPLDESTSPVVLYQGEGIRVYSSKPMNTFQTWTARPR